jgi:hypothetical protein
LTGHGDGRGGLGENRKKGEFLEEEFLAYLRQNRPFLGDIKLAVCWSQSEEREKDNGENLARRASREAGGRPTWGHDGLGHLDNKGDLISDEPGTRGQLQPGPFVYPDGKPRSAPGAGSANTSGGGQ